MIMTQTYNSIVLMESKETIKIKESLYDLKKFQSINERIFIWTILKRINEDQFEEPTLEDFLPKEEDV